MNPFKYSLDNKRYHTLNYHYKNKFNCKVFKVSLDAGFSCPNIDGKVGYNGCIYCSKKGNKELISNDDLLKQFNEVKAIEEKKWPNSKYIGYFQAHSNTYADINILKEKYELILKQDNIVGLNIATRPDCLNEEILNYLDELNNRTYLTVELGLQTIHESTSKLINRCHSLECFEEAVLMLKKKNIKVVIHIINGLPFETKEMMLETVKYLDKIKIDGIKIHMLNIVKNTPLEKLKNRFELLSKEEYINIVCDQLELLDEKIVIHRITGDPDLEDLVEPDWLIKKVSILNDIDKELLRRDSYQGKIKESN
ncbi:MAG: TIGR01212 family radical SAM protein [Bacilli bacterium]|nr:TIGR01212 family radical SAM protein [Bacilli bacterium]